MMYHTENFVAVIENVAAVTGKHVFGNSTYTTADPPFINGFVQQAEKVKIGMSNTVIMASNHKPSTLPVQKKSNWASVATDGCN
ncbi:hypothetical protein SUGI_0788240 [Cryptomeria japonica]|nr:hypothetical protein SUGI_0788240 [Cryptomeria japonica]